jgi:hypothetical protein
MVEAAEERGPRWRLSRRQWVAVAILCLLNLRAILRPTLAETVTAALTTLGAALLFVVVASTLVEKLQTLAGRFASR